MSLGLLSNCYCSIMGKSFSPLMVIMGVVFFYSANAQKVEYDYSTSTDFTKYKTYAWLAPGDSVLNKYRAEKVYAGLITLSANEELAARGLKQVKENPDAIFIFYTSVEEFTKYSQGATLSVGVGVAGPGYYAGGSAPVAGGKITATNMEDGTLSYAMYDTESAKLIWSGRVEKSFKPSDDVQKLITYNTTQIFKKLPIKKQKK
jgi:hypothetical protein